MAAGSKTQKKIHGVIVPMVTPLNETGELDEPAARRVIDHLVGGGVQGIFVLGTTGEGPSAPRELRSRLVHLAVEHTAGRVQVYAGIYDAVISESVEMAREFLRRGVTAVVAQMPAYFRLGPGEQFHYFAALAERARGPLLLYDIPSAVHSAIDPGVVEHLRVFPNVVGIKDSSGDRERMNVLLDQYADDPAFSVLVGATELSTYGLLHGADGFVPSAGNLNPSLCSRLYGAALKGDRQLMEELQAEVDAVQASFWVEGYLGRGIARLKKRMAQRGLCGPKVLLPLQEED